MTTLLHAYAQRRDWRIARFRIVAALIAVGLLLIDGIGIVAPWIDLASYHIPAFHGTLQRWYEAQRGAYAAILFTGSLLALLWRPRTHPLLLQFLILAGGALVVIGAPFDPFRSLVQAAAIALLALTYPNRAALAKFFQSGSFSWPLLALSLTTAALLALDASRALQALPTVPQTANQISITAIIFAITLALAGLLATTKRPGWQALGLLTGAALIYLGLVAAKLPHQAGSWGALGTALATLLGWAFVGATAWEMRLETHRVARSDGALNKARG